VKDKEIVHVVFVSCAFRRVKSLGTQGDAKIRGGGEDAVM